MLEEFFSSRGPRPTVVVQEMSSNSDIDFIVLDLADLQSVQKLLQLGSKSNLASIIWAPGGGGLALAPSGKMTSQWTPWVFKQ